MSHRISSYMPTIGVRISEKEKKELSEFGSVSEAVREGLKMYLRRKKTIKILRKLERLQIDNPMRTMTLEDIELLRTDRKR
ncbi:MAG: hypothetical protein JRN52_07860 [Nitrososphaerota archaeon]|nr:hypothetical protein [Nitrososphaerota archaeon]